jgi:hypothetical protein
VKEEIQVRWEYKVITLAAEHMKGDAPGLERLEVDLNNLGGSGWELTAVLSLADRGQGVGAIFKRPREGSMW